MSLHTSAPHSHVRGTPATSTPAELQSSRSTGRSVPHLRTPSPPESYNMASTLVDKKRTNSTDNAEAWDRNKFNSRLAPYAAFIDARYALVRMAQCAKFTFYQEGAGAITPFEIGASLLCFVVSIVICLTTSQVGSGQIVSYLIIVVILVTMRNNIMQLLLGVSWERALLLHKVVGVTIIACVLVHGVGSLVGLSGAQIASDTKYWTGLGMLIAVFLQPVIYTLVKPINFEVFYALHILVYIGIVILGIIHGAATELIISIILWSLDLLLRYVLLPKKVTLKATPLPGGITELVFDKRFNYRPGQYVFIMVPAVSAVQWHPYTLSSAPHSDTCSIHAKAMGNWSTQLRAVAKTPGPTGRVKDMDEDEGEVPGVQLTAFVEGPYGLPAVNLEDETYQVVLLLSGSIGVTPNQSIANSLIEAHSRGRKLKKIVNVWSVRDSSASMISSLIDRGYFPRNRATALRELESGVPALGDAEVLYTELYVTNGMEGARPSKVGYSFASGSEAPLTPAEAEQLEKEGQGGEQGGGPRPSQVSLAMPPGAAAVRDGRPNFDEIFARVAEAAEKLGESAVCVSVCGPEAMVNSASKACRRATANTHGVRFDLHVEIFNF
mmetsp:Transcript_34106/g.75166  ORF Transcript_34106/g.75166 Transcript_34106/m.75166 type:complete len:609 (-) Transcript_34106:208-2034(-)